mgnify:FL=1
MKIKEFVNPKNLKITYLDNKLNILNYDEIIILLDNKIILSKNNNIITRTGSNLSLLKLLDNEILIKGSIKNIEL